MFQSTNINSPNIAVNMLPTEKVSDLKIKKLEFEMVQLNEHIY